jgi:hypothetical protein
MMTVSLLIRTRTISLTLTVLLLAAGGQIQAQDKHIDVTIQNGKLVFLNSECPGNPEPGCVLAEAGSSPVISWKLSDAAGMDWQFAGLQFSPDGEHWGDPAHPLQDCTVADFGLSEADRQSGNASTAQVVSNEKRLQIRDLNRNTCITHYKLSARSANGDHADSDPIIDNRGGGGQN